MSRIAYLLLTGLLLFLNPLALAQREPESFLTIFQLGIPRNADFFTVIQGVEYQKFSNINIKLFESAIPLLQFYSNRLVAAQLPSAYSIIPMIESNNTPVAVSRVGAVGVWQLMPATAQKYGLQVNVYEDERYSILPSTEAAVKHLRYLVTLFDHPVHVLAAYNWGENNVVRLKKKHPQIQDFLNSSGLPVETKLYIQRVYIFWVNLYQINFSHPLHIYPNVSYFQLGHGVQARDIFSANQEKSVHQFVNPNLVRSNEQLIPTEYFHKYFQSEVKQSSQSTVKSFNCLMPNYVDYVVYVVKPGDSHQKIIKTLRLTHVKQLEMLRGVKLRPGLIIKIPYSSRNGFSSEGYCS